MGMRPAFFSGVQASTTTNEVRNAPGKQKYFIYVRQERSPGGLSKDRMVLIRESYRLEEIESNPTTWTFLASAVFKRADKAILYRRRNSSKESGMPVPTSGKSHTIKEADHRCTENHWVSKSP